MSGQRGVKGDRSVGVPSIGHGDKFADARARSKGFDELRAVAKRRKRKDPKKLEASDFTVGETVDVLHKASNGKVTYGRAAVLDVQRKPMTWRGGTVYVCWLTEAEDLKDHIYPMQFDRSTYHFGGHVSYAG